MKRKPLHPRGQEVCVRLCLSEWHLPHSCKDRSSHALIIIIDKWYLMSGIWLTAQPYPPSTWADTCVNLQRLKKKTHLLDPYQEYLFTSCGVFVAQIAVSVRTSVIHYQSGSTLLCLWWPQTTWTSVVDGPEGNRKGVMTDREGMRTYFP